MNYYNTDRLRQLAHCAADGAWSEFYMSIPPRPDHDADLVLSAAADEIDRLRAEIARLRADIAQLCGYESAQEMDGAMAKAGAE